jgi:hypothetical protein
MKIQHVAGCLLVAISTTAASAAETATFNAFSVWQGSARIVQTGATRGTVVGVVRGPMYVETDEGPTRTGGIVCPVTLDVDLENGRQEGHGRCTITANDGALAFGSFQCSGFHMVGCRGDFKLESGTDRLKGVTGNGPIVVKSNRWKLAPDSDTEVSQAATGIAYWSGFSMTMP